MLKWIFRLFLIFVIIVIAGIYGLKIYLEKYFDRDIIVKAVEENTNSRFEIADVKIGLFSFTPSLSLDGIKLGKRDNFADEKVHIDSRPALENEILSVEYIELKANLIPLLDKRFELDRFLIQRPVVRLTIGEKGQDNLSPLLFSSDGAVLSDGTAADQRAAEQVPDPEDETPSLMEEFTAHDLPIAAQMNQIGIENGEIDIFFQTTEQRFLISDLFMVIDKIDIDPKNLKDHNRAALTFNTKMSVFNKEKSEQAALIIRSNADVRPLNPLTGKIDTEALYKVAIGKGSFIQALVALEKAKSSLDMLSKVGIELDILSKKAVLDRDANTAIRYKEGKVSFEEDLKIETAGYDLRIENMSWFNVLDNQHSFKGDLTISEAETKKLLDRVDRFIGDSMNKIDMKGISVDPVQIRQELLSETLKDDRLFISFSSQGDISNPDVKVSLAVPSLTKLVTDRLRGMAEQKIRQEIDKAVEKAKEVIDEEAEKLKAMAKEEEEKLRAKAEEEKTAAEAKAKAEAEKAAQEAKKKIKIPGF